MNEFLKTFGAIFLVTGTCIGGGMLALPIVTAHCGFLWSLLIFLVCWLVMLFSSLLVLEVNSALPANASFSSMAANTLGLSGKVITWIMFLLLLYALLAAYSTGGASLLSAIFVQLKMPLGNAICAVMFTVFFGAFVFLGTRSTDRLNRILLSAKLLLFMIAAFFIMPHINVVQLQGKVSDYPYLLAPIPVVLTAFGSHFIIPSIRTYIGPDAKRLRKIIFIGMLIPLVVYIIWQVAVFGILPKQGAYSFASITKEHSSTGALVLAMTHYLQGNAARTMINAFMDIAVTTSFLGIALGLLDFFIDGLKLNPQRYSHRFMASILTLALPLLFAIYFPGGFILALEYAAIFAAVLVLIMPPLMSLKINKKGLSPFYRASGGVPLRIAILLFGVFIIVLHFAISFKLVAV